MNPITGLLLCYLLCSLLAVLYIEYLFPGGSAAMAEDIRREEGLSYVDRGALRFVVALFGPFILVQGISVELRRLVYLAEDAWDDVCVRVRIWRAILFLRRRRWGVARFMAVHSIRELLEFHARVQRAKAWTTARGWDGPWSDERYS